VSDDEIKRFCVDLSALFLPYCWASHSGQLELACDLNLPLIASDLPGLRSQLDYHDGCAPPILWFDPVLMTTPEGVIKLIEPVHDFLEAAAKTSAVRSCAEHRLREHEHLIGAYGAAYERSIEEW